MFNDNNKNSRGIQKLRMAHTKRKKSIEIVLEKDLIKIQQTETWGLNKMEISIKRENLKRNQKEVLELKSIIIKMKNSLVSMAYLSRRKNWETWRLDNGNYWVWGTERETIEEKQTEPMGPVGQLNQYIHHGSPRRRERERSNESILRNNG